MAIDPPTIAYLQSQGIPGFYVTCSNPACQHSTPIPFDALMVDPSTPLPAIEKLHRFVCSACGSQQVLTMPEWRGRRMAETRR